MTEMVKHALLIMIGLGAGTFTAAGTLTVINIVGIVPRYAVRTGTGAYAKRYEDIVLAGTVVGNFLSHYHPLIASLGWFQVVLGLSGLLYVLQQFLLVVYGLSTGIFIGCLAVAIEEMTQSIPIFTRKTDIFEYCGIGFLILLLALGKSVGAIFSFLTG